MKSNIYIIFEFNFVRQFILLSINKGYIIFKDNDYPKIKWNYTRFYYFDIIHSTLYKIEKMNHNSGAMFCYKCKYVNGNETEILNCRENQKAFQILKQYIL
jgi:hypothetical protein